MRASLSLLIALALAGHAAPAFAQAAGDKAAPRHPAAQDAQPDSVDALSPDEARRAARARARASAREQPAESRRERVAKEPPKPAAPAASAAKAAPKEAAARPPASETKIEPKQAHAAPVTPDQATHPIRRAARPEHIGSERETADLEPRHPRRRPHSLSARASDTAAGRAPRIGDVVPPGVPLYPVPPGYIPGQPVAGPGLPPFPRSRDDEAEDGPPRAFPPPPPY